MKTWPPQGKVQGTKEPKKHEKNKVSPTRPPKREQNMEKAYEASTLPKNSRQLRKAGHGKGGLQGRAQPLCLVPSGQPWTHSIIRAQQVFIYNIYNIVYILYISTVKKEALNLKEHGGV